MHWLVFVVLTLQSGHQLWLLLYNLQMQLGLGLLLLVRFLCIKNIIQVPGLFHLKLLQQFRFGCFFTLIIFYPKVLVKNLRSYDNIILFWFIPMYNTCQHFMSYYWAYYYYYHPDPLYCTAYIVNTLLSL